MNIAIEVKELTKYYGEHLAVDHISFDVQQGEIFGFLGPNGTGKSTTQRMLTTLLKPTSGNILINAFQRLKDEIAQVWTIASKDIRVYYLQPPMIMFGLALPFFVFFSFSIKQNVSAETGVAQLLAMTTFFMASLAGPVIVPLERKTGTYDRLLSAPMSLSTLLIGQTLVGEIFPFFASILRLLVGVFFLHVVIANPLLLFSGLLLASLAFSASGMVFGSIPVQSVGSIMMPSTLIRWPLLFISGIFIPLSEMAPWARILSYLSPLTYAQDVINKAVSGIGYFNPWFDLALLVVLVALFLIPAARLHLRSQVLEY